MNFLSFPDGVDLIEHVIRETGIDRLISITDIKRSFQAAWDDCEILLIEARKAERDKILYLEAVQDHAAYPHMARFHERLEDFLRLSLPPEVERFYRELLQRPEPAVFKDARATLVHAAAHDPVESRRPLWRFLLFQGIRLNLLLVRHWHIESPLFALVDREKIDQIAEITILRWFKDDLVPPAEFCPFHVLVTTAVEAVKASGVDAIVSLQKVHKEVSRREYQIARLEGLIDQMPAVDVVLVRNECGEELGCQRLSVEQLQLRHPDLLGRYNRNALDQRLSRARRRISEAQRRLHEAEQQDPDSTSLKLPDVLAGERASRPSFIDLLDEQRANADG